VVVVKFEVVRLCLGVFVNLWEVEDLFFKKKSRVYGWVVSKFEGFFLENYEL
jgi:hypothetical protein